MFLESLSLKPMEGNGVVDLTMLVPHGAFDFERS